jgi:hypothetical protein
MQGYADGQNLIVIPCTFFLKNHCENIFICNHLYFDYCSLQK